MACRLDLPAPSTKGVANLAWCSGAARASRCTAGIHGSAANPPRCLQTLRTGTLRWAGRDCVYQRRGLSQSLLSPVECRSSRSLYLLAVALMHTLPAIMETLEACIASERAFG